jgi:hypothetical protein
MARLDGKAALELGVANMDREHKDLVATMHDSHALDQKAAAR